MIVDFCEAPQPVQLEGYLCTCGVLCLPLQVQPTHANDVVVQISENDAGRFDPMEDGRVDWDATTVLVSRALCLGMRCA